MDGNTKTTPATIRKHANAIADLYFTIWQSAAKRVVWIPDGKGGRFPITREEDLLNGCFDIVGVNHGQPIHLIQYTSLTNVSSRRKKISERFIEPLEESVKKELKIIPRIAARTHMMISVWGFVPLKGFRVWRWDWIRYKWTNPVGHIVSPLWDRKHEGIMLTPHSRWNGS